MSAAYDQTVRYENAVDALPVAFCEAPKTFVAPVFNEARDPAPCFHCRSAAPLLARPPFVPVHVAASEAIVKFHGRFDSLWEAPSPPWPGTPPALPPTWRPPGPPPPPGGSNRRARTVSPLSQVSKNLTRSPPKRYANVG